VVGTPDTVCEEAPIGKVVEAPEPTAKGDMADTEPAFVCENGRSA